MRRHFGSSLGRIEKGAGDFATTADIAAEEAMLAVLRSQRPDDALLGEESGRSGAHDGSRTWLIDPLCGTLNYAAGMRVVAVNAALAAPSGVLAAFPNAPTFRATTLAADDEFATAGFRARVVSSSLALTWVATGQRAAYVTDGDVRHSVHFAAGVAICQAAGCTISDLHGDTGGQAPDGLIVTGDQETHAALVRLVRKQRKQHG